MTMTNGFLPPSWRSVSLREVLDRIEAGTSFKAQDRPAVDGEVGVLKLSAVTWSTFQPSENKALFPGCDPGNCPRVQKGDLLISRANTTELIAAVVMVQENHPNLLLSDKTLRLVPNQAVTCPNYLLHVLRTPLVRRHFERHATGTSGSMRNISQENIGATRIPLPPLPEQRRIAAILDKADAIRRKREEGIRLTEELLRSTFLEMFGDPVTNPKCWETVSLGSVTELVTSGLTPTGGSTVYVDDGPLFIRSQNVLMNRLDLTTAACLPESIHAEMGRTKVHAGDVLLNITGASIGRVAWVSSLPREANVNQHVCIIRLDSKQATPECVSVFLSLPFGQSQIDNMQSGASRQGLNHQQVRSLKVPLPPLPLQKRFSMCIEKIRRLGAEREGGRRDSEMLFHSLVQRAFRGEL